MLGRMYRIVVTLCVALSFQLGNALLSVPSPFSYSVKKVVSSLPALKPSSAEGSHVNKTQVNYVLSPGDINSTNYMKEAKRMKRAARELLAEAQLMEDEIIISKSKRAQDIASEIDYLIEELFSDSVIKNSTIVFSENYSNRNKRWSPPEKLMLVTKRLQKRFTETRIKFPWQSGTRTLLPKVEFVPSSRKFHSKEELDVESGNGRTIILASKLRGEQFSPEKLLLVTERLYQQFIEATEVPLVANASDFLNVEQRNQAIRESSEDEMRFVLRITDLCNAAEILDDETAREVNPNRKWNGRVSIMLESKLQDLHKQTQLKKVSNQTGSSDGIEGCVDETSRTEVSEELAIAAKTSLWLPRPFYFYLGDRYIPISRDDISEIQNEVLAGSRFFCTSVETNTLAASFQGTLREQNDDSQSNYTSSVFAEIQDRLANRKGLSQRLQLFFAEDPREPHGSKRVNILAIPKVISPAKSSRYSIGSSLACALTLGTTIAYAQACFALNPLFFKLVTESQHVSPDILLTGLPIVTGVLAIQAIHEISHRLIARRWKVQIGPPVPLPSPQLGIFGALTPIVSFPPNRAALLDIVLSGPLVGMLASLLCFTGGIWGTLHASKEALLSFPVIPIAYFKGSMLSSLIIHFLAPKLMTLPNAQPIPVHPAFCVGFVGLITNALNMLPISGFDGGRAVRAILGRTSAFITSLGAVLLLAFACLDNFSSLLFSTIFYFAITQFFREPVLIRDEVTPVSNRRCELYMATLFLALLALTPYPRAHWGL